MKDRKQHMVSDHSKQLQDPAKDHSQNDMTNHSMHSMGSHTAHSTYLSWNCGNIITCQQIVVRVRPQVAPARLYRSQHKER